MCWGHVCLQCWVVSLTWAVSLGASVRIVPLWQMFKLSTCLEMFRKLKNYWLVFLMLHLVIAPNEKQVFLLVMHSFFTLLEICLLELNSYPTNVFCEVTMTLAFGHQFIITPSWSPGRHLCLIWRKFSWKILGMLLYENGRDRRAKIIIPLAMIVPDTEA